MAAGEKEIEERAAAIRAGNRRDLARALSEVENETAAGAALLRALRGDVGRAHVVGITGPGGAGKSTLIAALLSELAARGQAVGVIAVDPSSPLSGGALLGDRLRMDEHQAAPGIFIRSLASRGQPGGIARAAAGAVDLLDAFGMDCVVVETVGTGQAEVAIRELADTVVMVCPPGLGDDVQAMKAGILEVADVLVVSKSDLPAAAATAQTLAAMLAARPPGAWTVPLIATAMERGVDALADALAAHAHHAGCGTRRAPRRSRQALAELAADALRRRLMNLDSEELDRLADDLREGRIDAGEAAASAWRLAASNADGSR